MKKKILFVLLHIGTGGAERVASILIDEYCRQGHDVALVLFKRENNEYDINKNAKVFVYDDNKRNNRLFRLLQRNKWLNNIMADFKPDIVIPFLYYMVIQTVLSQKKLHPIVIGTVRNLPSSIPKPYRLLYMYSLRRCSSVYCQTKDQQLYLPKRLRIKSFVVPNPVSDDFLKNVREPSNIKNFISYGRLVPQKNYFELIKAFCNAHNEFDSITLSIYGNGYLYDDLIQFIKEKQAQDYVKLYDRTEDISSELLKYDCFIMNSLFEGMPNALLEAMATGLPCISSDCQTGPKELLGNDERGLLVKVNDNNALSKAIIWSIRNPELMRSKGMAARDFILDGYNSSKIASDLLAQIEAYSNK